jgi:ribosomal protein L31
MPGPFCKGRQRDAAAERRVARFEREWFTGE